MERETGSFERRVSPKTKLIVLNSPENPTGGVLDRAQLERIAAIAAARDIPVLTDEIYRQFLYEGEFASITNLPGMQGRTILLDGFSKSYAMTGWRLGYGVMPPPLAEHVARLMVNSNSCTASFVQLAGIAALQGDQTPVAVMVAEFKRRRDLLVDGLNRLPGVRCARPRGAFYVFADVSGALAGRDLWALIDEWLRPPFEWQANREDIVAERESGRGESVAADGNPRSRR